MIFADLPNDYIAFNYVGNFQRPQDIMPYKQYKSGAKVPDNSIYEDKAPENTNPVLLLEFDILNKDGFGLKKGFYEIRPDDDYTCLMFIQAGKIAAKIPAIKHEKISAYGSDYEWPDKKDKKGGLLNRWNGSTSEIPSKLSNSNDIVSPKKIQPNLSEKERKRRDYKYKKGLDPIEYIHSSAKMQYDKELKSYIVIWEKYNTRVIGVFKTE